MADRAKSIGIARVHFADVLEENANQRKSSLSTHSAHKSVDKELKENTGLNRDSNPGPLAPKARIIPLDH